MKKICFVLVILFCLSSLALASEKEIEVSNTGKVRVLEGEVWRKPSRQQREAYNNPGKEIPLDLKFRYKKRISFFLYSGRKEYTKVVVYKNDRLQTLKKSWQSPVSKKFAYHVLFTMIAIFIMILIDTQVRKHKKIGCLLLISFWISYLFSAISSLIEFSLYDSGSYGLSSIMIYCSAYMLIVITYDSEKKIVKILYKASSVFFYAISIIILFI